ncbi:MAG: bifunctional 5,10-methylenetetrahydrofolate dehydrogenase/5,10-methenyltetrahydrofolate cyclohydrolase [Patescibacteria group bacterium]
MLYATRFMKLIDGKKLAEAIRREVKEQIETQGLRPGLAVILVGDDPASHLYVGLKERSCREVGIRFEKFIFPAGVPEETVIETIEAVNGRSDIHGILVQLPLPEGLDENRVVRAIDPRKDVDGFHPENLRLLRTGNPRLVPGVARGIVALIEATGVPLAGKTAALLVNSATFAEPIVALLRARGADSTVILAKEVAEKTTEMKNADILIVAIGQPKFIRGEMIKKGAVIIDIGTTRVGDRTVGDVDAESVATRAGWLSPVPGGVGPMTVAMLLKNVLEATKLPKK